MQTLTIHAERTAALRAKCTGWLERLDNVNWYQVAVVALSTFAISMAVLFPPCRVALDNGLTVYVGHVFWSPSARAAMQIDAVCLAIEIAAILVAAVVGWKLGIPDQRRTKR